jgi:hypothetical protein
MMMAITVTPMSAYAAYTDTTSVSGSSKFNNEWEKTTTYTVDDTVIGYRTYGYDMAAINEDYCWTKGTECNTTASLKRNSYDTSYQSGSSKSAGSYSKIEVQHQTYDVTYKIKFASSYSDVESSTATSAIK